MIAHSWLDVERVVAEVLLSDDVDQVLIARSWYHAHALQFHPLLQRGMVALYGFQQCALLPGGRLGERQSMVTEVIAKVLSA